MLEKQPSAAPACHPRTQWTSIYLACVVSGIAAANSTMYITSLWPYISYITPEGDVAWLGWALAATSFGSILADPLLGWWQERSNSRKPLICGFAVTLLGNFVYAFLPCFEGSAMLVALVVSRICLGFASSNANSTTDPSLLGAIGILRTFVSMNTLEKDRLAGTAFLSIGLTIGLSIGPVIQMCFIPLGDSSVRIFGIVFNKYTVPPFFISIICILCIFGIYKLFHENFSGIMEHKEGPAHRELPPYDKVGVAVLFYIWCIMMTAASSEYAIAAPMTMIMYGWSPDEVVTKHGLLQTIQCILATCAGVVMTRPIAARFDHRLQLLLAISLIFAASSSLYPWPVYDPVTGSSFFDAEAGNLRLNCEPQGPTCIRRRPPLLLYAVSLCLLYGPGAAVGLSVTNTLSSLVVGPRKQGLLQGWMTAAGSLASFLWPLAATALFKVNGMESISVLNAALYLIGFLLIVVFFKRLRPLRVS